ncbi:hypothetical protein KIKIMORA_05140 [Brevundimonas phage vB_BpoS-Kikimora]|uniref:Uncharacterized protein n=1 Tax=Brevundimonas phage vB_BpoS-Kikimora TaxID=2948601 RepID=A0A9E7MT69_9CAUD|nr:hypothetical protein KIKIMORA_05140 [Brevundimonas phage vB_BpoS-Kikimora]
MTACVPVDAALAAGLLVGIVLAFTFVVAALLAHASALRRRIVRLEQAVRTIRVVARHRGDEVLATSVEGLLRAAELDIDVEPVSAR